MVRRAPARQYVTLETDAIVEVLPGGVLTDAGSVHELDALVFATGFGVTRFLSTFETVGARWADAARGVGRRRRTRLPRYDGSRFPEPLHDVRPERQRWWRQRAGDTWRPRCTTSSRSCGRCGREDRPRSSAGPRCTRTSGRRVAAHHENLIYTHSGVNTYYRNSRWSRGGAERLLRMPSTGG